MKTRYKIAVWIAIASMGATFLGGSFVIWLIGLFLLRCFYRILWGCLLILLIGLFIFGSLFWILFS